MSIDQLATKFVSLAAKSTLTKAEHGEAQKLMRQLKEAGMSNEEISKLSNGKWSVPTVKRYTFGERFKGHQVTSMGMSDLLILCPDFREGVIKYPTTKPTKTYNDLAPGNGSF